MQQQQQQQTNNAGSSNHSQQISVCNRLRLYWRFIHIYYTKGATSGAGTAYPSGPSEFTPVFE
jgi:hypothetical protein